MELGGNAPFLVFDDADLDAAVDGAMLAKFRNMGQACTAANRFIVHEDVADDLTAQVVERVRSLTVGPGTDPESRIGPLIDERAVLRTAELVTDAIDRGARLLTGGSRVEGPGTFFLPTVLADVPADARLSREEIFAPVLAVTTVASEQDAVRAANDTEYGLVAYAYTRDLDRAHRLMKALDTGMLGINTGLVSDAAAPFGGVKQSGLGREGSFEGIYEYLETRYALIS
ncbi:aldehyde dehydrogenase family protein [Promicromonospora sp. AC04]|nr:aldehyde dehydrogenase family protein [Promicromonospora sp. AC04]PUB23450.1 aldehyde dehydrogenase family protein [Promicromonospora sp. AC04]